MPKLKLSRGLSPFNTTVASVSKECPRSEIPWAFDARAGEQEISGFSLPCGFLFNSTLTISN